MSVIWFSQKNKETITYVVILAEPTSLMYSCPYFLSCCLPQWPHFEQATLEWISYWEFTDMLLNWKDAIGWLVPALSSSCRVWQPLRLQITLHCTSQVAPGFLQLHLDVKLWAPQSDSGIYQEKSIPPPPSLGGGGMLLITPTVKLWMSEVTYLFYSTTVYYGSSSKEQHPQVSRCLCKLTKNIHQNKP